MNEDKLSVPRSNEGMAVAVVDETAVAGDVRTGCLGYMLNGGGFSHVTGTGGKSFVKGGVDDAGEVKGFKWEDLYSSRSFTMPCNKRASSDYALVSFLKAKCESAAGQRIDHEVFLDAVDDLEKHLIHGWPLRSLGHTPYGLRNFEKCFEPLPVKPKKRPSPFEPGELEKLIKEDAEDAVGLGDALLT